MADERTFRNDKGLWIIAALALILRLTVCMRLPTSDASLAALPDQLEYLESGRNLPTAQGLSFVDPRFGQRVFAYRMPGYPVLVSFCFGNIRTIRMVQCLLDSSVVIAVNLLAQTWLKRRWALFASIIAAFNPFQIYFCGLILSETLFIFLLVWGMALNCRVIGPMPTANSRVREAWANPGIGLLCIATMVRPAALLLPVLVAAITPSKRFHRIIATIAFQLLLLAPWAYRNHQVLGEWIWTTTNSGISAYDGLNPHASGASDQRFVADMPELQSMTEVERNRYFSHLANDFAIHHPLAVVRLAVIKLARLWSPIPLSAEYGSNLKLVVISLGCSVPFDLLVMIGLVFGRLPRNAKLQLMIPALYFSVVHAVGVGSLRYRIPADVPMTLIAASGVASIGDRKLYGQASVNA